MTEMKDDRRFHKLTRDQVETLDQVLTNVIPIHGRGNFPTLEIKPKDIIHMVRGRLTLKNIKVRDVRLNGSTASHVLVKENGTGYKDLDIIFGVELPKQEDFQIIKEVVLDCLLDFLPKGVNKDKITALTMKEAYVQKMVKVFTENDKWSLISLSNNCGKNVELKFVSTLRRQFEFSVDSFQIILDTMLQCYLDAERSALKASDGNTSSVALALETRPSLMEEPAFLMNVEHQQESCTEIRSSDIKNYVKIQKCCKLSQEKEEKCIVGVASTVDDGSTVKFADIDMDEEEPINDGIAKMSENATVIDGEQNNVVETQTQLGVNTCGSGTVSANKSELCVVNSDDVSIEETNTTPTYITVTDSDTAEYTLDIEPVNSQSCLEIVHTNLSSLSKGTFDDQCTFHLAPITFLVNATLETQSEYPPPPAKKSSSHMVVLKHSSPKPPRKMSKKTTAVQSTTNSNNITCQILRSPQPFPKEPLPMQMKQSGLATKSFELSSASRKDSNSLDTFNRAVTATAPENDIQSKVRKVNKVLPEDDLPSKLPTSETAELAPPPSNATNLIDETKVTQPLKPTEKCKTMPSANHPSSQTLLEENCNSSPPKSRDCQFCSIEDENPTLPCDFPKTSEPLTEKAACPSQTLNYLSDSGDLGTTSPISQVLANSASSPETLNQEVPCPKTKELQEPMPLILKPTGSLGSKVQSPTLAEPSDRTSTKLLQHLTSSPVSPESPTMTSLSLNTTGPPEHHCGISKEPEFSVQDLDSSGQQSSHIPMNSTRDTVLSENPDPSIPNIGMNLLQPKELPFITVMAESMYGDFEQALNHLRYRLIATRNPEEIRGGGLLKYSNLLVRDFKPACEAEIKTLERYMCSRFFIDFPDVNDQQRKIESYLRNHFIGEEKSKYDYLMTLRRVVNESTVCLMGHERRQTLNMITILALKVLGEQNIIPNANNVTCYYQPAAFMAEHSFSNYYISSGQSSLIYHPYPLHIHMQTSLV